MKIVIFGATGGIGRVLVQEALAAGHEVRVYARSATSLPETARLERMNGQLDDTAAVAAAIAGCDAVMSALGPRSRADIEPLVKGVQAIVAAMEASSVRRLIAISGAAVTAPSDKKNWSDRMVTRIVRALTHGMVEEKQRQLVIISGSSLEWTIVRPPGLQNKPSKGATRVSLERPVGMMITYVDLARFMLAQLSDLRYLRQAPFVAN